MNGDFETIKRVHQDSNEFIDAGRDSHVKIITTIANLVCAASYLELGVEWGNCFLYMCRIVERCVGVDIKNRINLKSPLEINIDNKHRIPVGNISNERSSLQFYEMTTDAFFAQNSERFDLIFIDADHHFECVKNDFENSLKFLNKRGIIFLHDTDPPNAKFAYPSAMCYDAYRIHDHIKAHHHELQMVTLPTSSSGLSIVQRKSDMRFMDIPNLYHG